jgi:methionyl-tRNA formyltransferase
METFTGKGVTMRIVFFGSGEIALPALRRLAASAEHRLVGIVAQPDKPAGRRRELRPPETKRFGVEHGIPVVQPPRIKAPEALDAVGAMRPDAVVVMAYGQILPLALIELPPVACLNLHASLLPRHRGAAPIHAAIAAGDRETGITVMYVSEGLDAGDVLLRRAIPIRRRETTASLHDRLAELAATAMGEALDLLAGGRAPRSPQEGRLVTYSPKLGHASGRIDWAKPAREIERLIRAMNAWPAAWTRLPAGAGAKEMKIFSAIVCRKANGEPGRVIRADEKGLLVGCAQGALLARKIQPEGARPMESAEFLRGHPISEGSFLG